MSGQLPSFYEPLIERDAAGARNAIRSFRADHDDAALFEAVARFAILAYSPSQHGKHALLSCLSAYDIREFLGALYSEVLTECAIYAADSRPPWSEPPITDPPVVEKRTGEDLEVLLDAIRRRDRNGAERWLAEHLEMESLARPYFHAALRCEGDEGHPLIMAVAFWRLATQLHPGARYATLRAGVWEMLADVEAISDEAAGDPFPEEQAMATLVAEMVHRRADVESAHRLFFLDAAIQASAISADTSIQQAAWRRLALQSMAGGIEVRSQPTLPPATFVYPLSRDLGALLKAKAIAMRAAVAYPTLGAERIIDAALANLQHGTSFEEWGVA